MLWLLLHKTLFTTLIRVLLLFTHLLMNDLDPVFLIIPNKLPLQNKLYIFCFWAKVLLKFSHVYRFGHNIMQSTQSTPVSSGLGISKRALAPRSLKKACGLEIICLHISQNSLIIKTWQLQKLLVKTKFACKITANVEDTEY